MGASAFYRCAESELGIQLFRHEQLLVYPEHSHSEMAIVICTLGSLESTQFSNREALYPDQILFTHASVPHSSRYCIDGKPTRGVTLEFSPAVLKRLGYTGASGYMQSHFLGKLHMPTAAALARRIEEEHQRAQRDTPFMVAALGRQIMAHVLREWPRSLVLPADPRPILHLPRKELVRSIEIMNATPARDFNVPDLARQLHRSTSTFSRLFARSVGDSPHHYHRTLLLQHAADLLVSSDRSVKEIALTLGFDSLSHFSNSFRSRWETTPTNFRRERGVHTSISSLAQTASQIGS